MKIWYGEFYSIVGFLCVTLPLKSYLNDSCWVGELPFRCAEPNRAESKKSIDRVGYLKGNNAY